MSIILNLIAIYIFCLYAFQSFLSMFKMIGEFVKK